MKGDFSRWDHDRKKNYAGVLHQQGRDLLDGDWNAQTRIDIDWQDRAARDTIGPGVAAVPVGERDSFKVKEAKLVSGKIRLKLAPGRTWADGLLISLPGPQDAERVASYLQPPIQTVPNPPANNGVLVTERTSPRTVTSRTGRPA